MHVSIGNKSASYTNINLTFLLHFMNNNFSNFLHFRTSSISPGKRSFPLPETFNEANISLVNRDIKIVRMDEPTDFCKYLTQRDFYINMKNI